MKLYTFLVVHMPSIQYLDLTIFFVVTQIPCPEWTILTLHHAHNECAVLNYTQGMSCIIYLHNYTDQNNEKKSYYNWENVSILIQNLSRICTYVNLTFWYYILLPIPPFPSWLLCIVIWFYTSKSCIYVSLYNWNISP